jgi:BlaI family penicillinase repressor
MARIRPTRLAAGELEIVQILWREGEVTLSEAQRAMDRPIGYTTVQTRLNRLVAKGVVVRSAKRPAKYRAKVAPEEVNAGHLELLLERVCGGSVLPLVAHLMQRRLLSPEEIAELKRLIAETEQAAQQARQ